jgi:hypothetical protein
MDHHATECDRRERVEQWIPTYPDWRITPQRTRGTQECTQPAGVIIPCREALEGEVPQPATRLGARLQGLGIAVGYTYARGHLPRGRCAESVVLRSRPMALSWSRTVGADRWTSDGGYAVWQDRLWPVGVTAAGRLLDELAAVTR